MPAELATAKTAGNVAVAKAGAARHVVARPVCEGRAISVETAEAAGAVDVSVLAVKAAKPTVAGGAVGAKVARTF